MKENDLVSLELADNGLLFVFLIGILRGLTWQLNILRTFAGLWCFCMAVKLPALSDITPRGVADFCYVVLLLA